MMSSRFVSRVVQAAEQRPTVAALLTTVLTLPMIAFFAHQWAAAGSPVPIDFGPFGPSGAAILEGRWDLVFRDPTVQAGPFELLPYGLAYLLHLTGTAAWTTFYVLIVAALALGVVLLVNPGGRHGVLIGAGCAVVASAQALLPRAVLLGHPAEVVIPVLWLAAARLARQDRVGAASVVVALSAGFEVWGVLGAVVILLADRPRLLRSAVIASVVVALLYGPFAATGDFGMFAFHWSVKPTSIFHAVWPDATAFPWPLRLLQGGAALAAGGAAALLLRRSRWAPWLVVLVVVDTRLLLDPVQLTYYWMATSITVIALIVTAAVRRSLPVLAAAAACGLISALPIAPVPRASLLLVIIATIVTAEAVRLRRPAASTRPVPAGAPALELAASS